MKLDICWVRQKTKIGSLNYDHEEINNKWIVINIGYSHVRGCCVKDVDIVKVKNNWSTHEFASLLKLMNWYEDERKKKRDNLAHSNGSYGNKKKVMPRFWSSHTNMCHQMAHTFLQKNG